MKCLDCKHGVPETGQATVSFDRNNCTVIIQDVPALVCPICSAYYPDESTTQKVLDAGNAAIKNETEVEIIRLKAA
ncbi:MAG: type II toxin-antitoxin system MqsA family antitoxin [Bacteroidetes bacterium]|nr:type II toxin-antitoxin system MqsA family antitoxin [Bacteroidota bacterium]MBL0053087.1 type II toxin-antitoxin system MqsA family antitoxin [Bacteroidota bacterium]